MILEKICETSAYDAKLHPLGANNNCAFGVHCNSELETHLNGAITHVVLLLFFFGINALLRLFFPFE